MAASLKRLKIWPMKWKNCLGASICHRLAASRPDQFKSSQSASSSSLDCGASGAKGGGSGAGGSGLGAVRAEVLALVGSLGREQGAVEAVAALEAIRMRWVGSAKPRMRVKERSLQRAAEAERMLSGLSVLATALV